MVSIIATLVSRYTIEIPADKVAGFACKPGEGERERRERIVKPFNVSTLTPGKVPLVFRPRTA